MSTWLNTSQMQFRIIDGLSICSDWPEFLTLEQRRLRERIGHLVLDIQHVGSTAVPGLAAKPIIDISVAVASPASIALCRQPLGNLGYLDRGDAGREGGYRFVKESAPEVRTHHLHEDGHDAPCVKSSLALPRTGEVRARVVPYCGAASSRTRRCGRLARDRIARIRRCRELPLGV